MLPVCQGERGHVDRNRLRSHCTLKYMTFDFHLQSLSWGDTFSDLITMSCFEIVCPLAAITKAFRFAHVFIKHTAIRFTFWYLQVDLLWPLKKWMWQIRSFRSYQESFHCVCKPFYMELFILLHQDLCEC